MLLCLAAIELANNSTNVHTQLLQHCCAVLCPSSSALLQTLLLLHIQNKKNLPQTGIHNLIASRMQAVGNSVFVCARYIYSTVLYEIVGINYISVYRPVLTSRPRLSGFMNNRCRNMLRYWGEGLQGHVRMVQRCSCTL